MSLVEETKIQLEEALKTFEPDYEKWEKLEKKTKTREMGFSFLVRILYQRCPASLINLFAAGELYQTYLRFYPENRYFHVAVAAMGLVSATYFDIHELNYLQLQHTAEQMTIYCESFWFRPDPKEIENLMEKLRSLNVDDMKIRNDLDLLVQLHHGFGSTGIVLLEFEFCFCQYLLEVSLLFFDEFREFSFREKLGATILLLREKIKNPYLNFDFNFSKSIREYDREVSEALGREYEEDRDDPIDFEEIEKQFKKTKKVDNSKEDDVDPETLEREFKKKYSLKDLEDLEKLDFQKRPQTRGEILSRNFDNLREIKFEDPELTKDFEKDMERAFHEESENLIRSLDELDKNEVKGKKVKKPNLSELTDRKDKLTRVIVELDLRERDLISITHRFSQVLGFEKHFLEEKFSLDVFYRVAETCLQLI